MKILGIDTTTKFLSIGIYDNAKVYEYNLETGTRLSSLLSKILKGLLDALGWQASNIDYFACGLGPGSFTGIRVGLSTVKGLAYSLNKPIIGIPTLDILAKNVRMTDDYIVPIIDAKRKFIYCSFYKIKNGRLKRIAPYMLLTLDDFFRKIENIKPACRRGRHSTLNIKHTKILGDGVDLYRQELLRNIRGITLLDKDYWYPRGSSIIDLAQEKIRDKKFNNSFRIKPIYLYPKECQIRNADSRRCNADSRR